MIWRCASNSRYGETFVVPEPHILPSVGRIADLAEPESKMSKSLSSPTGIIELLDDPAINVRKIKSAVTDSGREIVFDEINKPGVSNLLTILSAFTGTPVDVLVEQFAGRGYGDLKTAVADAVTAFAAPYRDRTFELMEERGELESILAKGADRAREVASATLGRRIRESRGRLGPSGLDCLLCWSRLSPLVGDVLELDGWAEDGEELGAMRHVQGEFGQPAGHALEHEPAVVIGVGVVRTIGQQQLNQNPGAGGRPAVDAYTAVAQRSKGHHRGHRIAGEA